MARSSARPASDPPSLNRGSDSSAPTRAEPRRERELLEAAVALFHRRGYADTSMQDVADALGIRKGSLYHYIDTKEDLLFRALEDVHDDVQTILDKVLAMEDATPLERIAAFVREQATYNARNPAWMAVYSHDIEQLGHERQERIVGRLREHGKIMRRLIEDAQRAGEIDPALDSAIHLNLVLGAVVWIYQWYRPEGSVAAAQVGEIAARFVVDGLAHSTAPKHRRGRRTDAAAG